ncbi:MAG: histidine--tRNA ligase [Bdellovibrionales bacterium RBG_16_40_8]|nr:MAG: histidine--tRNA ligase [Bdellovibrionales bacterium RBG_16_40_8]
MSQLQPVRGTHDLLNDVMRKHRHIINRCLLLCERYGFNEIKTPIFEFSDVFLRTLGETSDIVSKEMYTFLDKGGDSISLRPEGTAGVVRAFISEGLTHQLPLKLFYEGPMFRYERPQKGRYRQFYQIGVELLGVENPDADVEVISLAELLLKELGVLSRVQLEINSIGDKASRDTFRKELVNYYKKHEKSLSEESLRRLLINPMRILDSKDRADIAINQNAPQLEHFLNPLSKEKFTHIQKALDDLKINYKINPRLVRGLDYYCHLVFEFRTTELGSQDAVLSGGRYDGLSEIMGGAQTPAVGWAAGVERLSLLIPTELPTKRPISLIPLGDAAEGVCRELAHQLRSQGFAIDMAHSGNMSNRMKKATKQNAVAAIIIGDNELQSGDYTLKILDTGAQLKVKKADLAKRLNASFSHYIS